MMRIWFLLATSLAALASCTPLSIYHREGVAVSRMQSDLLSCDISAQADVPVNNQIRQEPPVYVPPRRVCDANGTCTTYGGYFEQGQIFTVDVNADLRKRAKGQCMGGKGYAPVTVPNCPNRVFRTLPRTATQVLPRLTPRSCAVQYQDGSWQIVTQAP